MCAYVSECMTRICARTVTCPNESVALCACCSLQCRCHYCAGVLKGAQCLGDRGSVDEWIDQGRQSSGLMDEIRMFFRARRLK